MSRRPIISLAALISNLQAHGPQTALELAASTRVHRSQVSRTLAGADGRIVQIGEARRSRYALRRQIRNLGEHWPIFRIDSAGRAQEWAHLEAFYGGWRIIWKKGAPAWADFVADEDGWMERLPFFLEDLRPQGFLGRSIARRISNFLALSPEPTSWNDDDLLVYLLSEGDDLPGNIVVGETPLRRALGKQLLGADALLGALGDESGPSHHYPHVALDAMQGTASGAALWGDQPKFLTYAMMDGSSSDAAGPQAANIQPVLVKFSQSLEMHSGRRWADLLIAEAHALDILARLESATQSQFARPRMLDAGGRRFFEFPRFDRVGAHGRRGVITLAALYGAVTGRLGGGATTWAQAAEQLGANGWIEPSAISLITRRQLFGELIGNSEMQFENLSFWLDDSLPFMLAPTYDMLPMLWAPALGGEIVPVNFAPLPPTPTQAANWQIVAAQAEAFWNRLAAEPHISPQFNTIALDACRKVAELRRRFFVD